MLQSLFTIWTTQADSKRDIDLVAPSARRFPNCCSRLNATRCTSILKYRKSLLFSLILFLLFQFGYETYRYIVTISRPLWDIENLPDGDVMMNFGWSGSSSVSCPLHNWTDQGFASKVYDVFPLSNEWDLLEIRLEELYPVVTLFYIFEMPCFFDGTVKKTTYNDFRSRYSKYQDKIVYIKALQDECEKLDINSLPMFSMETKLRTFIRRRAHYDFQKTDVIFFGDLDEIPRRSTVELLRYCTGWPVDRIQLEYSNFMYSFSMFSRSYNPKPAAYRISSGMYDIGDVLHHGYRSMKSPILSEAGWHCSWCFGSIEEIIQKMKGYSHRDRLRHERLLSPEVVLENSCSGTDPLGYDLEVYSFSNLLDLYDGIKETYGTHNVPLLLQNQPHRFRFLLPGGCRHRPYKN